MNTQKSLFETIASWIKHSIMLKLSIVGILILILLIPTTMIQSIIDEREQMNRMATEEVSSKWANEQLINGPILTIPLSYERENKEEIEVWEEYLHILPESLNINGSVDPEKLKRGIYEIVVYKSQLVLNGDFITHAKFDRKDLKQIHLDQAFLTIGISDLRGIEDEINLSWNEQKLKATPGTRIPELISTGVTIELPEISFIDSAIVDFKFDLKLQGSQNMSFVPLGSTTNVALTSPWPSPSFNGDFLPDERTVGDKGFEANWKILQLNRNFPQSWMGNRAKNQLATALFGVDLMLPLDDYQKATRSAKYAIMTIALSFLVFFLVEIINGRKIHPFQYTLVGLSLCLFYILLISISEHSNFNLAYLISSIAVIAMIFLYSFSVFRSSKLSALLSAILIGLYGFLFVTLQMADYALLMGSIGLTAILALTMYFTRNIDWYQINQKSE
ncbi:cell envelope integrity protein CreD [Reichenbachiella ulvae]|uniref:Cell envelope integrity protein CreD n=1 Tax=Reichenbachiella ulvae TaxID=2980104 RepID=A0ABT3CQF5_9BACT|nr:cell envelope integrity protein CreD [Reichenbachiella ulvae]MCV9385938.1 cell envelope integrity protein CreD [Reichenbachiella ulvae]